MVIASFNLLNPTGHVLHQQFNIQQLYALPTLYLCVLNLYERGTLWPSWLRHCATSRKVAGSIPDCVIENFSLT